MAQKTSEEDKFIYLALPGRGEVIRIMYALAECKICEETISMKEWPTRKSEFPMQQVPVMKIGGLLINQTTTIARYVAKKLKLNGSNAEEELLNDNITENVHEMNDNVANISAYKRFKDRQPPANPEEAVKHAIDRWKKLLDSLENVQRERQTKWLVGDKIMLADAMLYCGISIGQQIFPELREVTSWTAEFINNIEKDERVSEYLAKRPNYTV